MFTNNVYFSYEEIKESISYGANSLRDGNAMNTHQHISELVLPSEIMSLPSLSGYLCPAEAYPISKFKVQYKDRKSILERFIEKKLFPKSEFGKRNW